jgi:hypothetical protein
MASQMKEKVREADHYANKINDAKEILDLVIDKNLEKSIRDGVFNKEDVPEIRKNLLQFAKRWETDLSLLKQGGSDDIHLFAYARITEEVNDELRMRQPWADFMFYDLRSLFSGPNKRLRQFNIHPACVMWARVLEATLTKVEHLRGEPLANVPENQTYSFERAKEAPGLWAAV